MMIIGDTVSYHDDEPNKALSSKVHIQLPHPLLPESQIDLSHALVIIGETYETAIVFILDPIEGSLYHLVNKPRRKTQIPFRHRNGYAITGEKIYFIGGCYNNHNFLWSQSQAFCEIEEDGMLESLDCNDEDPKTIKIVSDIAAEITKWDEYVDSGVDQNREQFLKDEVDYENKLEAMYAQIPGWNLDSYSEEFKQTETYQRSQYFENNLKAKVDEIRARDLDVDVFNLKTRNWDPCFPKLNAPKPSPIVFVYLGKIYALAGPPDDENFSSYIASFEFLDPQCSSWTNLPDPPIPFKYRPLYMLNEDKGTFLLRVDCEIDGEAVSMLEFDLKSHKWNPIYCLNTSLYVDAALLLHTGSDQRDVLEGCLVDHFIFCYDSMYRPGKPLIVVYDLREKVVEHGGNVSLDLSKYLDDCVDFHGSYGYLNHLGGGRFSLVIFYYKRRPLISALCTLSFQLESCSEGDWRIEDALCKNFQLPNYVDFLFCKKC